MQVEAILYTSFYYVLLKFKIKCNNLFIHFKLKNLECIFSYMEDFNKFRIIVKLICVNSFYRYSF